MDWWTKHYFYHPGPAFFIFTVASTCFEGCLPWLRPHRQPIAECGCLAMCVYISLTGCCRVHWSVRGQHVGWVWWIPGIVASYLRRAYNHYSPDAAYCRGVGGAKPSEIYSEAGVKPLDFVIIHRPKSLPSTHRAIFIPGWMYFLGYISTPAHGWDFLFREEKFFSISVKFERWLSASNESIFRSYTLIGSHVNASRWWCIVLVQ